jgi:hypothetical protein
MNFMIADLPGLGFSVVTSVELPNPQNHTASAVTSQMNRVAVLDRFQAAQLDVAAEKNRYIADLLNNYFREYPGSSFAVTYTTVPSLQTPSRPVVPSRRTPFGHLNFLASPVEGIYFDPDDAIES